MKSRIDITDEEREIVDKFLKTKYPPIYKTDNTDRILFLELVEFDVCAYLSGKKSISNEHYAYILSEYEKYLTQTDEAGFDDYAEEHFKLVRKLMEIFKKYYG